MTNTTDLLSWASMTAAVNEIKSPNSFLKEMLFSRHEPKETDNIEVSVWQRGRKMAPFVRRDGEAIAVQGGSADFQVVQPPHIRIKMPIRPSQLIDDRRPGSPIFISGQGQRRAAQEFVAKELQALADDVSNREEWLCAQALTGTITYSVADGEHFTITLPKPVGHTTSAVAAWTTTTVDPKVDFLAAKRLAHNAHGLPVTDAIMSQSAAALFMALSPVLTQLDTRNLDAGRLTLAEQFRESGAIYLGRYSGIDCWEYSRLDEDSGSALIRADYVEFVSRVPAADNVLYYGAIADQEAFESGRYVGERFSKSWIQKDPSLRIALLASNPLPIMRRPGSVVSMDVG